nr:hypothetical protein [Candidatus Dormibacteraeota bacterium]
MVTTLRFWRPQVLMVAVLLAAALTVLAMPPVFAAGGLQVYAGYADLHHGPTPGTPGPNFPTPWIGDANVVTPNSTSNWDAGAIRLDNPTGADMTVYVTVSVGDHFYDLWGAQTVPAGATLVLTESQKLPTPDSPDGDFDTSDFGPNPPRGQCTPDPNAPIPVVHVTIDGITTDLSDGNRTLTTGGVDAVGCPPASDPNDESQPWSYIGDPGSAPASARHPASRQHPAKPGRHPAAGA